MNNLVGGRALGNTWRMFPVCHLSRCTRILWTTATEGMPIIGQTWPLRLFLPSSWPHLGAGEKREDAVLRYFQNALPWRFGGLWLEGLQVKFKFAAGKQFDPEHTTKTTPCYEVYDMKCMLVRSVGIYYSSPPCINFQESTWPGGY